MTNILLALALSGVPAQDADVLSMQLQLKGSLNRFHQKADELRTHITNGFVVTPDKPVIGFGISSDERTGVDGLHALRVTHISPASAAQRSSIRIGDRIIAINDRRIEHESGTVVLNFLDGLPDLFQMTVLREQETIVLSIQRAPLPCIREAIAMVDARDSRRRMNLLMALASTIEEELARVKTSDDVHAVTEKIADLWNVLPPLALLVQEDITQQTPLLIDKTCNIEVN